ncbi:MAG: hypothetical protein GF331_16710 [Chitinivibrionales bacterium]|nr:hypothetical protein [Chitinivibrionales bacterium]
MPDSTDSQNDPGNRSRYMHSAATRYVNYVGGGLSSSGGPWMYRRRFADRWALQVSASFVTPQIDLRWMHDLAGARLLRPMCYAAVGHDASTYGGYAFEVESFYDDSLGQLQDSLHIYNDRKRYGVHAAGGLALDLFIWRLALSGMVGWRVAYCYSHKHWYAGPDIGVFLAIRFGKL